MLLNRTSERDGDGKHGYAEWMDKSRGGLFSDMEGQEGLRRALEDEIGEERGPQFMEYQLFQSRVRFSQEVHGGIRQEEHSAAQRQNGEQPIGFGQWVTGTVSQEIHPLERVKSTLGLFTGSKLEVGQGISGSKSRTG